MLEETPDLDDEWKELPTTVVIKRPVLTDVDSLFDPDTDFDIVDWETD